MPEAARTADLMHFLDASPTSYHAVAELARRLEAAGFTALVGGEVWGQLPNQGFTTRDGALIAWRTPAVWSRQPGLRIFAAHSDSPALKLKPHGLHERFGYQMANVEVYGGPLLPTWFDRDLSVAGRIVDLAGTSHLVHANAVARVPSLAIHLDRSQNSELRVEAQRDLVALLGLASSEPDLATHLADLVGLDPNQVGGHDLFLVADQPATRVGTSGELLASARLDNLLSVHSGLSAFLAAEATDDVQLLVVHDHEEVGSHTASGASGPFAEHLLRRLSQAGGFSQDAHHAWLDRGWCLSADVTHAVHPNRPDRHDPTTRPVLGGGPVLKWSAAMRYGTDATTMACWTRACRAAGVEHQVFVNNNSVPGGASLGPLAATRLGIRTVDAGVAVLGMHSIRELCAVADPAAFAAVARAFLAGE